MIFSSIKNKALRIGAWVVSIFLLLIIVLLAAVKIYVAVNKDKLITTVKTAISNNIAGQFELKDIEINTLINFPNVAINLRDVTILDSVYKQPFLKCGTVSCRVNIFKIATIQHQLSKVVLEDGLIRLFTDTSGYENLSIFSKRGNRPKNKEQAQAYIVRNIVLDEMEVIVDNKRKEKYFQFYVDDLDADLSQNDTMLHVEVAHATTIKKMVFNEERGSYFENNLVEGRMHIYYNKPSKTLRCEKSDLAINEQPYSISALFSFGEKGIFHIDAESKELSYQQGLGILTPKLRTKLATVQIKDPLKVHAVIDGPLSQGAKPVVNVTWETKNNTLSSGITAFYECSFTGGYTNNISDTLPHTDEYSIITFNNFKGKWRGLLLTGDNIKVQDLTKPNIRFNFASSATLADIDNAIGSQAVTFLEGTAALGLSYNGPLVADPEELRNLNATLQLKGGKILYEPKGIVLENCAGFVAVEGNKMEFKDFRFDFKKNHFVINVTGSDLSGLSKNTPDKADLVFNIHSPSLHLDEILQVMTPPTQVKKTSKKKAHFAATAREIDALFEHSNWSVNLSADTIKKGNFLGNHLKVNLRMRESNWDISKLSLNHAGGAIAASGKLLIRDTKTSAVNADIQLQQLNIQRLLQAFDNFGQKSITSNNLRGILNATAKVNLSISNTTGRMVPRSMNGAIDFSLKNGAIVHHKGLEEMKLLFFKNRDMSNIRFAELKDRIDISPSYLYINRMEIESSAVSMFVEGQYDIYGKNTDLMIQVPFSNFGKRDEDYKVKNKGVDAKTGMSIWINAKNDDRGEIKLVPRLSKKKFKKDRDKEK